MTPLGTTLRQLGTGSGSSSPAHPGPDPAPGDQVVPPCAAWCQYQGAESQQVMHEPLAVTVTVRFGKLCHSVVGFPRCKTKQYK